MRTENSSCRIKVSIAERFVWFEVSTFCPFIPSIDKNGDAVAKTITLQGADLSDFSFTKTTIDGVGGYLLSAVAVPEPAEWAMIFGAIALGLAIYRRRK